MEIKAFLPEVGQAQLEAADFDELFQLAAQARLVEELWRDIFTAAIGQALGGQKT